jgi:hypothetical protein
MSEKPNFTPILGIVQDPDERIELANQLFHEFHSLCFWHSPRDLVITEELIPFVVKGLRANGGRRGFMLAGKLQPEVSTT